MLSARKDADLDLDVSVVEKTEEAICCGTMRIFVGQSPFARLSIHMLVHNAQTVCKPMCNGQTASEGCGISG